MDAPDNKRFLLAIALCLGVYLLFMGVILPWYGGQGGGEARPPGEAEVPVPAAPVAGGAPPQAAPAPVPAAIPAGFTPTPALPERIFELKDPAGGSRVRVELTNRGAAIRRLALVEKRFRAAVDRDEDLVLLDEFESGRLSLAVRDLRPTAPSPDLASALWEVVDAETSATRGVFRYARADGVVFRKEIALGPGYLLTGSLRIENRAATAVEVRLAATSAAGVAAEPSPERRHDLQYMAGLLGGEPEQKWQVASIPPSDLLEKPKEIVADRLRWAGTGDRYFASVFIPGREWEDLLSSVIFEPVIDRTILPLSKESEVKALRLSAEEEAGELGKLRESALAGAAAVLRLRDFPAVPGVPRELTWSYYAGPKDPAALDALAVSGLGRLVDYGFWGGISRFLLWILDLFHRLTGNYGWSIVLLTILVRLCIVPLSIKSQVSMARMQKIQPLLKAVQDRYKDDRQRQMVEQQKLMKQHRVSPWSSCMPLLFQMPVFIGLYQALILAIELRHAPFLAWIRDLSQPDRLCPLPFVIFGQTHLNLLPILMLVPMVVQSAMAPKPADPMMAQQQKMMMWMMPAMFLLMCYTMPSGVSLYWLFSSLWGLAEYRVIKKVWLKDAPAAAAAAPVSAPALSPSRR